MSATLNKVHLNNTTRISLNDRFTIIQSVAPKPDGPKSGGAGGSAQQRRSRSRSRSRSRARNPVAVRQPKTAGSFRNRQLLESLEKKHKMRAALKIKNKSIRGGRPRLNRERRDTKRTLRSTLTTMAGGRGGGAGRRIRRSNSLANIATMNADLVERGNLRRSNSQTSLAGRLGARRQSVGRGRQQQLQQPLAGAGRRRLKRSNSVSNLRRSNSRGNLSRANSQTNLVAAANNRSRSRSRNRGNLTRSNSRTNLNRAGSRTNLQLQQARNLRRANSKVNNQSVLNRLGDAGKLLANKRRRGGLNRTNFGGNVTNLQRSNSRGNLAVNSRLGAGGRGAAAGLRGNRSNSAVRKRGGANNTIIRGRVFKRTPNVVRNNQTVGGNAGNGRVGRALNRGGAVAAAAGRGRARSRSRTSRSRVRNQSNQAQPVTTAAEARNRRRQRGRARRGGLTAGQARAGGIGRGGAVGGSRRGAAGAGRRRGGGIAKAGVSGQVQTPKSREELDNELEQYMANTKSCLDRDMEEYMKGVEY